MFFIIIIEVVIVLHYYHRNCNNPRYPDTTANAIRHQ